jgi:hypothetical protein
VLYYQQKQRKTEVASQARERTSRYLGRIKDKDKDDALSSTY